MRIPFYHVDAFTAKVFGGNPAAVCPLDEWLPTEILQAIAAEHNLAETAYYVARPDGDFDLRWFTPEVEVDLCGHATLASAHVLMSVRPERKQDLQTSVTFHSKSGPLHVLREADKDRDRYTLNFPARPPVHYGEDTQALARALGAPPQSVMVARDYLCIFAHESEVRNLAPDMAKLAKLDRFAMIVTAPGSDCDFVSRFFAPSKGIPEDPVTGSAHCTLIPYWADRLGKNILLAKQISRRGGQLSCESLGDRVTMSGHATSFSSGVIELDETRFDSQL